MNKEEIIKIIEKYKPVCDSEICCGECPLSYIYSESYISCSKKITNLCLLFGEEGRVSSCRDVNILLKKILYKINKTKVLTNE